MEWGQDYKKALHHDTIIACHSRSKYDEEETVIEAVVCTGHIVAQINSCKRPNALHKEMYDAHQQIRKQDNFEELKSNTLSAFNFDKHHGEK